MLKFLNSVAKFNTTSNMFLIILVILSFIIGLASYLYYGKDNEITHVASEIIQHETGIDIERILPDSSTTAASL
jgi:hypothetical protein